MGSHEPALAVGQRVGPYEVLGALGAGGMGQVYRARDTRLDRHVAVKVLPAFLAAEDALVQRFVRESKALAALSHPNILAVFDVGTIGPCQYIVTELLEGETLRLRLVRGALSVTEALVLADQLARGLLAAHERGIVHRDLKPDNVFLTTDGRLKLLDFGLARTSAADPEPITQPGAFMGTPGYMAPEQARGVDVDARADIFSFGAVLYELLTGRRAFDGVSPMDRALSALTKEPPELSAMCEGASPEVFRVVRRCVEKSTDARFPSVRQLLEALSSVRPSEALESTLLKHASASPSTRLPMPATSLVGREEERAQLCELLQSRTGSGGVSATRLVTVTGPGGVGKTRLSLAVATQLSAELDCGATFVALAPVSDPAAVPYAIASTLGVAEVSGTPLLETLKGALRDGRRLLVLDNFEHVLEAAPVVGELLAAAPGLRVLVTSRAPLRLSAEQVFPLSTLGLPGSEATPTPEMLGRFPASRLFVERARSARAGFEATAENAPDIVRICARLEGLPLALELAAMRLRLLSTRKMAEELAGRGALQSLTGASAPRDLPERQRTLWATIEWSHALLPERAQRLFSRLSVFFGGFTLEDAKAVAGADFAADVVDQLAALVDSSLVRRVESGGDERYVMLEMLREFGAKQLEAVGEADAVREAHARHFLAVAKRTMKGGGEPDGANVQATLGYFVARRDGAAALEAAEALMPGWRRRGPYSEACRWFERILGLADQLSPEQRLIAALRLGDLEWCRGERAATAALLDGHLALARAHGDVGLLIDVLHFLAKSHSEAGHLELAAQYNEEELALARPRGGARLGNALLSASYLVEEREPAKAAELVREAATHFDAGDVGALANVHNHLGEYARFVGQLDEAAQHYRDARRLAGLAQDHRLLAAATGNLSVTMSDLGLYAEAEALLRQAFVLDYRLGARSNVVADLLQTAAFELLKRRPESALRFLGAAEEIQKALGTQVQIADRAHFHRTQSACKPFLAQPECARAYEAGRRMSLEEAMYAAATLKDATQTQE